MKAKMRNLTAIIAAILALSNGVNGYIKKVEEDTLSSYPLTISKQDYDLSSMMGGQGAADDDMSKSEDSSDDSAGGKAQGTDKIPVVTAVKDMFASVKSNDMTSFKAWLDDGGDGIGLDGHDGLLSRWKTGPPPEGGPGPCKNRILVDFPQENLLTGRIRQIMQNAAWLHLT